MNWAVYLQHVYRGRDRQRQARQHGMTGEICQQFLPHLPLTPTVRSHRLGGGGGGAPGHLLLNPTPPTPPHPPADPTHLLYLVSVLLFLADELVHGSGVGVLTLLKLPRSLVHFCLYGLQLLHVVLSGRLLDLLLKVPQSGEARGWQEL